MSTITTSGSTTTSTTFMKTFSPVTADCQPYSESRVAPDTRWTKCEPVRPDSRPKPANLMMSPTERAGVFRQFERAMRHRIVTVSNTRCAGKSAKATTVYDSHSFAGVFPLIDLPPWEIQMRNKIKSARVNMAETIGEWRETADAVAGGADSLRKAWKFLRKLKHRPRHLWPRELRHLWDRRETLSVHDVPAAYLVTIFGIAPWVSLANDAAEALRLSATRPIIKRYAVTRKAQDEYVWVKGSQSGECRIYRSGSVRAVCYVRYKANIGDFTSGNVLEALWAGVPLSFVVDWFISIGSWLTAIDALEGVQSITGTVTTRHRVRYNATQVNKPVNTGESRMLLQPGTGVHQSYSRETISDIGLPFSLEVGNSATLGKLISTLAILHQVRRSS